ncbi:MAG: hypothetical protein EBS29_13445, partial [Chloroflexia bacterium]|nr:hypothetical protein [Chloroflexia bacterium]
DCALTMMYCVGLPSGNVNVWPNWAPCESFCLVGGMCTIADRDVVSYRLQRAHQRQGRYNGDEDDQEYRQGIFGSSQHHPDVGDRELSAPWKRDRKQCICNETYARQSSDQ